MLQNHILSFYHHSTNKSKLIKHPDKFYSCVLLCCNNKKNVTSQTSAQIKDTTPLRFSLLNLQLHDSSAALHLSACLCHLLIKKINDTDLDQISGVQVPQMFSSSSTYCINASAKGFWIIFFLKINLDTVISFHLLLAMMYTLD